MPTISIFYGIQIMMYLARKEHNPPHFHAVYQEDEAVFDIQTGEKIKGNLPRDKERLVSEWFVLHRDELLANWKLARNGEPLLRINPLS